MGLYLTVSEKTAISVTIAIFPPRVFNAPDEGVPLGIGYRRSVSKTRMMELPGRERSLTISSALWIIHERDGQTEKQTDRQTDTGRQQGPRLRYA